jgi:hypothetical protein
MPRLLIALTDVVDHIESNHTTNSITAPTDVLRWRYDAELCCRYARGVSPRYRLNACVRWL